MKGREKDRTSFDHYINPWCTQVLDVFTFLILSLKAKSAASMENSSIDEAAASVWGANGYSGLLSVFSDVNIRAEQGVMQFA